MSRSHSLYLGQFCFKKQPAVKDLCPGTVYFIQTSMNFALNIDFLCRSYSTALVSVCDSGLLGIIILLISSAISGFLFTTLVWCNSHTWIYFKHKGRYIKVSTQVQCLAKQTRGHPYMTSSDFCPIIGIQFCILCLIFANLPTLKSDIHVSGTAALARSQKSYKLYELCGP